MLQQTGAAEVEKASQAPGEVQGDAGGVNARLQGPADWSNPCRPERELEKAKGMLGVVFSLVPHLNNRVLDVRGSMFSFTKYIWKRGKKNDPPYMIIGCQKHQAGTSNLKTNFICHMDSKIHRHVSTRVKLGKKEREQIAKGGRVLLQ